MSSCLGRDPAEPVSHPSHGWSQVAEANRSLSQRGSGLQDTEPWWLGPPTGRPARSWRVIPKGGNRFSEKITRKAKTYILERDDDSKKNHPALIPKRADPDSSFMRPTGNPIAKTCGVPMGYEAPCSGADVRR
jgi:hypothetical protein